MSRHSLATGVLLALLTLVGCSKPAPVTTANAPATPTTTGPLPPVASPSPASGSPAAPPPRTSAPEAMPPKPAAAVATTPATPLAPAPAIAPKATAWEQYAARGEHPLANAQVGDFAVYRAKLPDLGLGAAKDTEVRMKLKVKERTDTTVTLSRESSGRGLPGGGDITYDLTQPWQPVEAALMERHGAEVKLLSRSKDVVRTNDFVMSCEMIKYQIVAAAGDLKIEPEVSAWISPEAPLTGLAAMELDLLGLKVKMILDDWGPQHPETLREVAGAKLVKNEHSRLTFASGDQTIEFCPPTHGLILLDQGGKSITGFDQPRYLAAGNVFHIKTALKANTEALTELKLEQGGPSSIALLVAALPRTIGSYDPEQPRLAPAIWHRTLARAKVGDWVVYREKEGGRVKYREVTEVKPAEVIAWEVYNLEKSYTHGVRMVLDEPDKPKASKKTTKKTSTKKTTKSKQAADEPAPPASEETKPAADEPLPRVAGTETVAVTGRELSCEVVELPNKSGRGLQMKLWLCADVPFDGVVRREWKGKLVYLLEEFGRAE